MQTRNKTQRWLTAVGAVALAASAMTAQAITDKLFDFNEDPTGVLKTYGNAEWRPDGGNPAAGGYLSITDAINSQSGIIVFDDFDNGLIVKGFNFKVDLRVGNPVGQGGRPADGFSVNFARQTDPIIVKADADQTPDSGADSAGAAEFGTKTGIAVSFDTWSGNVLPDSPDLEGVIVRVDNKTITRVAMPTRNGACDDATSLQTGPYNADTSGAVDGLCWAGLEVDLDAAGLLTVKWKSATLLDKFATTFAPSRGRIVFMGRTGGANQNNHIDNIRISTIPASTATIAGVDHTPTSFTVKIDDAPGSVATAASVVIKLDGATVPATATKSGDTVTATYSPATPFLSGSSHELDVTYADAATTYNEKRNFTTEVYGTLTAAIRATGVNTSQPGFRIRPHQVQQTTTILANTIARAENQLAGGEGANAIDLVTLGADAQGYVTWPEALNVGNSGGAGSFPDGLGLDSLGMPGMDADGNQLANENNSAFELLTYVNFPTAGFYRMGVRSDDGFRLQAGGDSRDVFAVRLGQYDGGRGMDPGTEFYVRVIDAGTYPVRMVWQNGDGGAGAEWYVVESSGTAVLVNDGNVATSLKAYRTSTAAVPYVASVVPGADSTGIHAQPAVAAVIENAGSVDANSVTLSIDGTALTTTKTTAGTRLTVQGTAPSILDSGSVHKATLSYTPTGGTAVSREWSFTVIGYSSSVLPTGIAGTVGAGTVPGFRVRVVQLDTDPGQTDAGARGATELVWTEGMLSGKAGANVADLTTFTDGGYHQEATTINYSQPGADGNPEAAGNFNPNRPIPGIPGTGAANANTDTISAEVLTFVEFPTTDFYMMGVNSDDGFKVTSSHAVTQPLTITAPANIVGALAGVASVRGDNQGGGIFAPLPTTPIEGDVVVAQGNNTGWDAATPANQGCGTALVNAAAVQGKIVLVSRGTCPFLEKVRNAASAGAIGVLAYQNRTDPPLVLGGDPNTLTIPAFSISQADGAKLTAATGAKVRIQGEAGQVLGSFGAGRGASDTIFGMRVDQAGVYPLRLIWQEGGGGANLEWFSVTPSGTKILLNDTAAGALKTWQKATIATRPTLAIATAGADVKVTYTGTLQSADSVNGPYTDVAGASGGSYTTAASGAGKFYRARN